MKFSVSTTVPTEEEDIGLESPMKAVLDAISEAHRPEVWAWISSCLSMTIILLLIVYECHLISRIYSNLPTARPVLAGCAILSQVLLFGIFLLTISVLAYNVTPTQLICGVRRMSTNASFAVVFGVIFVKLIVLVSLARGIALSCWYQAGLLCLIISIQVVINAQWVIYEPPGVVVSSQDRVSTGATSVAASRISTLPPDPRQYNEKLKIENNELVKLEKEEISCRLQFKSCLAYCSFPMVMLVIDGIISLAAIRNPYNYREAAYIAAMCGFVTFLWISWIATVFALSYPFLTEFATSYTSLTTAIVVFCFQFIPAGMRNIASAGGSGLYPEDAAKLTSSVQRTYHQHQVEGSGVPSSKQNNTNVKQVASVRPAHARPTSSSFLLKQLTQSMTVYPNRPYGKPSNNEAWTRLSNSATTTTEGDSSNNSSTGSCPPAPVFPPSPLKAPRNSTKTTNIKDSTSFCPAPKQRPKETTFATESTSVAFSTGTFLPKSTANPAYKPNSIISTSSTLQCPNIASYSMQPDRRQSGAFRTMSPKALARNSTTNNSCNSPSKRMSHNEQKQQHQQQNFRENVHEKQNVKTEQIHCHPFEQHQQRRSKIKERRSEKRAASKRNKQSRRSVASLDRTRAGPLHETENNLNDYKHNDNLLYDRSPVKTLSKQPYNYTTCVDSLSRNTSAKPPKAVPAPILPNSPNIIRKPSPKKTMAPGSLGNLKPETSSTTNSTLTSRKKLDGKLPSKSEQRNSKKQAVRLPQVSEQGGQDRPPSKDGGQDTGASQVTLDIQLPESVSVAPGGSSIQSRQDTLHTILNDTHLDASINRT